MAGKDGALFVLILVLFSNVFLFQNLVSTWNEENNNQFSYLSIHLSEYPFDKSENPKEKLALRDLNFEVSKPNQINSSNQFCVETDFTPTVDESPFLGNNLTAEKHLEFTIKAYASSNNILPTRFNETEKTAKPFSIMQRYKSDFIDPSKDYIYILVNSSVYSSIETSMYQFIKDLEDSGFLVELYSGSWGTPENTKHFLQNGFSSGLIGAILIGDIPTAWYEMDNPGDESFPEHEEFPIDLYYMDLDGIWNDLDGDGLYDMHNGDVTPEIWVGRLKASGFISDEASLLNNYFRKNHRYRNGGYTIPRRALVYVDDDWTPWADDDNETLELLYSETILVKDNATTNARLQSKVN